MEKKNKVNLKCMVCEHCEKKFRFNFTLNKHLEKCRVDLIECKTCKSIIEKSAYIEHVQTHISGVDKIINSLLNIKLSKSSGVWKSTLNCVYKCKICFENFESLSNLTEHIMKTHEANDGQIQSTDCSMNISADELENDNILQNHNKSQLKRQDCNLKFDAIKTLNSLLDHYSKKFRNVWNKFQANDQDKLQIACCCMNCGLFFTTKDSWAKHFDEFQKNKNCIKPDKNSIQTSTNIIYYPKEIVNDITMNLRTESRLDVNFTEKNSHTLTDIPASIIESTVFKTIPYTDHNSLNIGNPSSSQNMSYYENIFVNDINRNMDDKNSLDTNFTNSLDQANISPAEDNSLNPVNVSRVKNNKTPKKILCRICWKKCSMSDLINHMKSHHVVETRSSSNQLYKCKNCKKTFNRKASYSAHILTHNIVKNTQIKKINNKNSVTVKSKQNKEQKKQNYNSSKSISSSLIQPRVIGSAKIDPIHHQNQSYKCQSCKKKYSSIFLWKKHLPLSTECRRHYNYWPVKLKPMKTRNSYILCTQFKCYICEKKFRSLSILINHITHVHLETDSNSDSSVNAVEQKLKTVTTRKNTKLLNKKKKGLIYNRKSEPCQLCGKSYSSTSHLNRHIRDKHAKSDSNTNINVVEQRKKLKTETTRKNTKLLNKKKKGLISNRKSEPCQLCGKSYSSTSHLNRHVKDKHANSDRNTNINLAEQRKKLKTETTRKNTKLLNKKKKGLISNRKSEPCQLCGKSYSSKSHLYRHVRNKHASKK